MRGAGSGYGTKRARQERIVRLVVSSALALTGGWMFMLAVGVVHHEWIPQCPTIGYGWATLLAALLRAALYDYSSIMSERAR